MQQPYHDWAHVQLEWVSQIYLVLVQTTRVESDAGLGLKALNNAAHDVTEPR